MHGNPTNEQDADTIYSVSGGSANTEAKFGKAVSKTTYPIEISENSKVESIGRGEMLVEPYKTLVDTLIVRRGKKGNQNDAPFPSLSPVISNGNPPFTFKGELLKRFHVAKFSEEDRHDSSPDSAFNEFQAENKRLLKVLGDWTIRYILDHKTELLLSKKYNPYQVGEKALQAFFEFADREIPEWLTRWLVDTSLEELDQDVEEIIRSILYNHVHKTIRENPKMISDNSDLGIDSGIRTHMSERITGCIVSEIWPWIQKVGNSSGSSSNSNDEAYYILSSILELFSSRLPDLTLKKFAEKTGFAYVKGHDGKARVRCTKKMLDEFIGGGI